MLEMCKKEVVKCELESCEYHDTCLIHKILSNGSFWMTDAYPAKSIGAYSIPFRFIATDKLSKQSKYVVLEEIVKSVIENKVPNLLKVVPKSEIQSITTLQMKELNFIDIHNKQTVPRPKKQFVVETGINRSTRTTTGINKPHNVPEQGFLFAYEGIRPGSVFSALVYTTDDDIYSVLKNLNGETIRIGRGKSRGYGLCKLYIQEYPFTIEKRTSEVLTFVNNGYLAAITLTPLFVLDVSSDGIVSKILFDPEAAIENAAKLIELHIDKIPKVTLAGIIGTTMYVGGWSNVKNQPNTRVRALAPGSLLILKVNEELDSNMAQALVALEIAGITNFKGLGFGMMMFVDYINFKNGS